MMRGSCPPPREDQRRIPIDDDREARFRRQRLALDRVEDFLPAARFGHDEGGDGIRPCCSRGGRKLADGCDARDDLGSDGIGIRLRQGGKSRMRALSSNRAI